MFWGHAGRMKWSFLDGLKSKNVSWGVPTVSTQIFGVLEQNPFFIFQINGSAFFRPFLQSKKKTWLKKADFTPSWWMRSQSSPWTGTTRSGSTGVFWVGLGGRCLGSAKSVGKSCEVFLMCWWCLMIYGCQSVDVVFQILMKPILKTECRTKPRRDGWHCWSTVATSITCGLLLVTWLRSHGRKDDQWRSQGMNGPPEEILGGLIAIPKLLIVSNSRVHWFKSQLT